VEAQNPARRGEALQTPTLVIHGAARLPLPIPRAAVLSTAQVRKYQCVASLSRREPLESSGAPQNSRLCTREFFTWLRRFDAGSRVAPHLHEGCRSSPSPHQRRLQFFVSSRNSQ